MAYIPTLGRFLQEDPAGYIDGVNRSQFELSSPVASTDPEGEDVWIEGPVGEEPNGHQKYVLEALVGHIVHIALVLTLVKGRGAGRKGWLDMCTMTKARAARL